MLKPMIRFTMMLSLLALPLAHATEVYMSVDENGNPVFTDQPSDDARKIEVEDIMTIPALEDTSPPPPKPEPVERYRQLSIVSPKNEETYFRSQGDLVVDISVSPRIRGADRLVYYLDGKEIHSGRSTSFSVPELDRGTHTVSVSIVGGDGKILKTTEPVTFYMRQASRLN